MRSRLTAVLALSVAAGCARVPPNSGNNALLLLVQAKFRGDVIQPGVGRPMYYFVLINRTDNLNDPGPVPVVQSPWGGNGFATASQPDGQGFVGFIQYDTSGFGVYSLALGGVLHKPQERIFQYLGTPEFSVTPRTGDRTLTFQLDLNRLPNPTARYAQVNIVSTDTLPVTPDDTQKLWDALEDGTQPSSLTPWVTLDTTLNDRKTNAGTNKEPAYVDVRDRQLGPAINEPSLDLIDWSVEIQRR